MRVFKFKKYDANTQKRLSNFGFRVQWVLFQNGTVKVGVK